MKDTFDAGSYDRSLENMSNIVLLEHVNLHHPDQRLATAFYVAGMGFTRDPYLMVGLENMWVNIGRTQIHLPTREPMPQRLRGTMHVVVPSIPEALNRLERVGRFLKDTDFSFRQGDGFLEVRCPWGNRFVCWEPDLRKWGSSQLGLVEVQMDVAPGTASGIARFYVEILSAPAHVTPGMGGLERTHVRVGADQYLSFVETNADVPPYDGHHIQIYLADFSGPYAALRERGLISRETDEHEWRFIRIVDVDGGQTLFELEHEVRSMRHPLFGRQFVNRNTDQTNTAYVRGQDDFRGTF